MASLAIIPMPAANAIPVSKSPTRKDLADTRPPWSPNNSQNAPKKNMIVAPTVLPLIVAEFIGLMSWFDEVVRAMVGGMKSASQ